MIEEHLRSTWDMLKASFPDGLPNELYIPLLCVLYEEMSDRNLAAVVAELTKKEYPLVYNDVLKAGEILSNREELNRLSWQTSKVKTLLESNGYREWLNEE